MLDSEEKGVIRMTDITRLTEIKWLTDYQEALNQAKQEEKLVYLDFWADG